MKFQDLLMPIASSLALVLIFQYFWDRQYPSVLDQSQQAGQRIEVPQHVDPLLYKKRLTEVDFLGEPAHHAATVSVIETPHARYHFTTEGALLRQVEFRLEHNRNIMLSTIDIEGCKREDAPFLVALAERTPYYYTLVSTHETDQNHTILYHVETADVSIEKQFVVDKASYQLDLNVTIKPKGKPVEPRILFPAPTATGLTQGDAITGIVFDHNKLTTITSKEGIPDAYWARPTLVGGQDRYFVHALVKDADMFVQRAYFKPLDTKIYAILEGPEVREQKTWNVSFYCGPKLDAAMTAVDPRLIDTLNYGFFGFMTKHVAHWLRVALGYLYDFFHNYGLAIIILTILMKLIMLPFTYKAEQTAKESGALQKRLHHLEQKYKHDPQALAEAKTELITKHGMPGLAGCLPMLAQIPIFLGLSWVLSNGIELYQAPFLWISDLSSPDPLSLLSICFGLAFMLQMTTAKTDAKQTLSVFAMAVVVGVFSSYMPAGLTLYILVGTLITIVQNLATKKLKL